MLICRASARLLSYRSSNVVPTARARTTAFFQKLSSISQQIEEETLAGYRPLNYYPAKIGELINGTHTLRVKLGYGRSSTTWLCSAPNNQYKVLKISTADGAGSKEATNYKYLKEESVHSQNPGRYCVRRPEEVFDATARGKTYQCFVFAPLGPSLLEYTSGRESGCLQLAESRLVVTYLLHALSFLHEHAVIHTDMKLDNIQLTLPDNDDEVLTAFVADELEIPSEAKSVNGMMIYRSRLMVQSELTFPISCDLGSAKCGTPPHSGLVQPLPYRAPEVILGAKWDEKLDIWSLGVLTWELVLGERLFGQASETSVMRLMLQYLGPPPQDFLTQCSARARYYDELGLWKGDKVESICLEDHVDVQGDMSLFFDFIRSMLTWDPHQRFSASALLKHPWLESD